MGQYFSFGNKANYVIKDNSSVSTYNSRTAHGCYDQNELDAMAMQYDIKCTHELQTAQNILCTVFPLNKILVMPIISAADHVANARNIKSPLTVTNSSECGCWASCICVNAETKILHTENDCTYTIIYAPQQNKTTAKYEFNFCLNPVNNVSFDMNDGISFMFSGMFLKHKQYKWKAGNVNDIFYNFASYGNQRLFNHLKQTILRRSSAD